MFNASFLLILLGFALVVSTAWQAYVLGWIADWQKLAPRHYVFRLMVTVCYWLLLIGIVFLSYYLCLRWLGMLYFPLLQIVAWVLLMPYVFRLLYRWPFYESSIAALCLPFSTMVILPPAILQTLMFWGGLNILKHDHKNFKMAALGAAIVFSTFFLVFPLVTIILNLCGLDKFFYSYPVFYIFLPPMLITFFTTGLVLHRCLNIRLLKSYALCFIFHLGSAALAFMMVLLLILMGQKMFLSAFFYTLTTPPLPTTTLVQNVPVPSPELTVPKQQQVLPQSSASVRNRDTEETANYRTSEPEPAKQARESLAYHEVSIEIARESTPVQAILIEKNGKETKGVLEKITADTLLINIYLTSGYMTYHIPLNRVSQIKIWQPMPPPALS